MMRDYSERVYVFHVLVLQSEDIMIAAPSVRLYFDVTTWI